MAGCSNTAKNDFQTWPGRYQVTVKEGNTTVTRKLNEEGVWMDQTLVLYIKQRQGWVPYLNYSIKCIEWK
jgi:hypothetical protein